MSAIATGKPTFGAAVKIVFRTTKAVRVLG